MNKRFANIALLLLGIASACAQAQHIDSMRGRTPIPDEPKPPALGNPENRDVRRERANRWNVSGRRWNETRQFADAWVARCRDQFHARILARKCIGERVLTATGADQQTLHAAQLMSGEG